MGQRRRKKKEEQEVQEEEEKKQEEEEDRGNSGALMRLVWLRAQVCLGLRATLAVGLCVKNGGDAAWNAWAACGA